MSVKEFETNSEYFFLLYLPHIHVSSDCHANQIVFVFDRYTEELHPYKYAGYPMLVKTIRMETDDDKLFSKSAPLLAAAAECAYYTVKCSALNAEELRR